VSKVFKRTLLTVADKQTAFIHPSVFLQQVPKVPLEASAWVNHNASTLLSALSIRHHIDEYILKTDLDFHEFIPHLENPNTNRTRILVCGRIGINKSHVISLATKFTPVRHPSRASPFLDC
jgi:hypothetical protein